MRKLNSVCFSQEKRTIHIIDDLERPQAKRLDNWHISHLCRHCTDYSTGSPRLMQFHFMRDLWIYFTWHIRWQFMNIFLCGISQWRFEISQPQNLFQFCSKMSVGLTLCPAVSPIQPIFNPAIPKRPGKMQVLRAFLSKTKTCFVVGTPQSFIEKFHKKKNYLLIVI